MKRRSLRLLIVVADPWVMRAVRDAYRCVEQRAQFTTCGGPSAAVELLRRRVFDCVLLDLSLPDTQCSETLARLRDVAAGVPVVVLVGAESEMVGGDALAAGAQDYIVRGAFDGDTLVRAIGSAILRGHYAARLRESEERYRHLVENAGDIIYSHDLEGRYTSLNRAGERITGYSRDEARRLSVTDLLLPEHLEESRRRIADGLRGASPEPYEVPIVRKDGRVVWLEVHARLERAGGRPVGVEGVARDITSRKLAEMKLRESEALLRRLHQVFARPLTFTDRLVALLQMGAERFGSALGAVTTRVGGQLSVLASIPESSGLQAVVAERLENLCAEVAGRGEMVEAAADAGESSGVAVLAGVDIGAPLFIDGRLWGALAFVSSGSGQPCSTLDREILTLMAQLLAAEIEREERGRETSIYSELGDLLQSCATPPEVHGAIRELVPRLFPRQQGGIALAGGTAGRFDVAARWRVTGTDAPETLEADQCWAIQRGRAHYYGAAPGALPCPHFGGSLARASVCIPILGQGETLGAISLQADDAEEIPRRVRQLASAVADRLGASLANLRLVETLRAQVVRDPLTGLFNRRYMLETLDREMERVSRGQRQLALGVVMADIDHFKRWNDLHGHAAGDDLLRLVARLLVQHVRLADVVCRYGGEEFVLILPEVSLEMTADRAEMLCREARKLRVAFGGEELEGITLSIGVAAFPVHGVAAGALMEAADRALYRAKAEGRDRVMVAG